jgi:isocitrate dehydrogenase
MKAEAQKIMDAMRNVFAQGYTTPDLRDPEGKSKQISTTAFTDKVVDALRAG